MVPSKEVIVLVLFFLLFCAGLGVVIYLQSRRLQKLGVQIITLERQAKKRGTNYDGAARATLKGQIAEQVAPMLPGFPYHPSDFRFLGQPVDFICYVGLTEAKEGLGNIHEIVIGDIKMNTASLSPHQRMIKKAVEEGRVRWETIHIEKDFTVNRKHR